MPIQQWSEGILHVQLQTEPQLSEDLNATVEQLDHEPMHVMVNMQELEHLNSSNLAQLLRLRKKVIETDRTLKLCCVGDGIWSVMLVTGLDKVFEFSEDVPSALASIQMDH